jgi:hypothetical protein
VERCLNVFVYGILRCRLVTFEENKVGTEGDEFSINQALVIQGRGIIKISVIVLKGKLIPFSDRMQDP